MWPLLKAEFRKLLTVRSTYVIIGLSLLAIIFFAGYIEGWNAGPTTQNPHKLAGEIFSAISAVSVFGALVAVLLFAHEYRYNTIMYTLTSSNSRTKTLLAKIIAVTVFALLFTTLMGLFSPLVSWIGSSLHGLQLVPQTFYYADSVWRWLFFGWGYAMMGLLLIALIRHQLGAIVALFLGPSTVEPLLSLLLKENSVYLPFSSLQSVINTNPNISSVTAAFVFLGYVLFGWLVAWLLFLKRDAN